jgi:hypothetical protein
VDWIELTQDSSKWKTFLSTEMNFRVKRKGKNFMTSLSIVDSSRKCLLHVLSRVSHSVSSVHRLYSCVINFS